MLALGVALVAEAAVASPGRLSFGSQATGRVSMRTAKTQWQGTLNLLVRNHSARAGKLVLRYFPDTAAHAVNLSTANTPPGYVRRLQPRGARLKLRPHQALYVRLSFNVPKSGPPSAANGLLVARLRSEDSGRHPVRTSRLRVKGVAAAPRDLAFDPSRVTLDVEWGCGWRILPPGKPCDNTATITLRGEGARELLAGPPVEAFAVLRNGSGATTELRLRDVRSVGGVVRGTIAASAIEGIGELTGELVVNPATPEAARLPIVVRVGSSFRWVFLLVTIGALLALFVRWNDQIGRKRLALRSRLRAAINGYTDVLGQSGNSPASYDLEATGVLGPPPWDTPFPDMRGVRGLLWEIANARSDSEFERLQRDVDEKVKRIGHWVAVEPSARELRDALRERTPDLKNRAFARTRTYHQAQQLLYQSADPALEEVEGFVRQLQRQTAFYRLFRRAWELNAGLLARWDQLEESQRRRVRGVNLPRVDEALPELDERTPSELSSKMATLGGIVASLEAATPEGNAPTREAVLAFLGGSVSRPKSLAEAAAGKLRPALRSFITFANARDLFLTLVVITATTSAYALTLYNETWGSIGDIVTAVTAGFGAKFFSDAAATHLSWASLPGFLERLRIRQPVLVTAGGAPVGGSTNGAPPSVQSDGANGATGDTREDGETSAETIGEPEPSRPQSNA